MSECMSERAMWIELATLLEKLPTHMVGHRKGEGKGDENRPLYSLQLNLARHSAWVVGYGWPDYETPFITGPTGTGAAQLLLTLRELDSLLESYSAAPQVNEEAQNEDV